MLNTTSASSTRLLPTREVISVKKFLLNLPVWRFSMESPATVDLTTDSGVVRLIIVEQGWSWDWPVPETPLKQAVTDLREGRLKAGWVVLVDLNRRLGTRASVQRVVKNIGTRPARHGVFWMDFKFKSAVKCFPRKSEAVANGF